MPWLIWYAIAHVEDTFFIPASAGWISITSKDLESGPAIKPDDSSPQATPEKIKQLLVPHYDTVRTGEFWTGEKPPSKRQRLSKNLPRDLSELDQHLAGEPDRIELYPIITSGSDFE